MTSNRSEGGKKPAILVRSDGTWRSSFAFQGRKERNEGRLEFTLHYLGDEKRGGERNYGKGIPTTGGEMAEF